MYRPPTYLHGTKRNEQNTYLGGMTEERKEVVNAGMYTLGQSSAAAAAALDIPLFRWGEKLIGYTDMRACLSCQDLTLMCVIANTAMFSSCR